MNDPDIFLDSNIELDRAMRDHPSGFGLPRYTVSCPGCGRGMRSKLFLVPRPDSSVPVCTTCRTWFQKLNHKEELRRSP
jgi:hypothetical protein